MSNQKLNPSQITEIKRLWLEENKSSKEISELYPVNFNHIQRVCKDFKPNGMNLKSFKSPNRKLNEYQVKKILISCLKNNESKKEIAEKYNVSVTTIHFICKGINWPHVFQGYQKKYKKEILRLV